MSKPNRNDKKYDPYYGYGDIACPLDILFLLGLAILSIIKVLNIH